MSRWRCAHRGNSSSGLITVVVVMSHTGAAFSCSCGTKGLTMVARGEYKVTDGHGLWRQVAKAVLCISLLLLLALHLSLHQQHTPFSALPAVRFRTLKYHLIIE